MSNLLYSIYYITTINHGDSILFNYLLPILAVTSMIVTAVAIKSKHREIQFFAVMTILLTIVTVTGSILYTFFAIKAVVQY